VFFYVGVPAKSIIGFASVKSIEQVSLREAIRYKDAGCITEVELRKYIGNDGFVHAIHIENAVIFEKPIVLADIKEAFGFNPPQSFSNVSDRFERRLTESGS
jgi:predicted transcriptional regulator